MTVTIKIGRRTPKKGMMRLMRYSTRFLSGQEHLWTLITNSFQLAKKKSNEKPDEKIIISIDTKYESEDLKNQLEWKIVTIKSEFKEKEEEEYIEAMKLFDSIFTKQNKTMMEQKMIETMDIQPKPFKTTMVVFDKIKEAGFKYAENKTFANIFNQFQIVLDIQNDWEK